MWPLSPPNLGCRLGGKCQAGAPYLKASMLDIDGIHLVPPLVFFRHLCSVPFSSESASLLQAIFLPLVVRSQRQLLPTTFCVPSRHSKQIKKKKKSSYHEVPHRESQVFSQELQDGGQRLETGGNRSSLSYRLNTANRGPLSRSRY